MGKKNFVLYILLLTVGGAQLLFGEDGQKLPAFSSESQKHHFETARAFGYLKHEFLIKNNGNAPLSVRIIDVPKDCTAWISSEGRISARGTLRLVIIWLLGPNLGLGERVITVKSNDPHHPLVKFSISASITDDRTAGPETLSSQSHPSSRRSLLTTKRSPVIVFDSTTHDFGEQFQGKELTHVFKFTNNGEGDLKIKTVAASCGCIVALLSDKKIPKGAQGKLKVSYKTGGRRGKVYYTVKVFSNDPKRPVVKLGLTVNVKAHYDLLPQIVNFGRIKKGRASVKKLVLIDRSSEKLKIKDLEVTGNYLKIVCYKETAYVGHSYEIDIGLNSSIPIGALNEKLIVHTNLMYPSTIEVPIKGEIVGDVRVMPKIISYGFLKRDETARRSIKLYAETPDFKILSVQNSTEFLFAKVDRSHEDRYLEVMVELTAPHGKGMLKEKVNIRTTSKYLPLIEIPVYAYIRH